MILTIFKALNKRWDFLKPVWHAKRLDLAWINGFYTNLWSSYKLFKIPPYAHTEVFSVAVFWTPGCARPLLWPISCRRINVEWTDVLWNLDVHMVLITFLHRGFNQHFWPCGMWIWSELCIIVQIAYASTFCVHQQSVYSMSQNWCELKLWLN